MTRLNALELWSIGGDNAAVIWCSNRKKLEEEEHSLSLWQRQLPICLALSTSVSIYIFIHIYIHFFTAYIYTFD